MVLGVEDGNLFYGMGNVLTQFANIFSGIVFIYTETCFKKIKLLCPFTEGFYPSAFMSQHTPRDILAPSLSPFYARTLEDSQTRWGLSHFQYRRGRPSVCAVLSVWKLFIWFSARLCSNMNWIVNTREQLLMGAQRLEGQNAPKAHVHGATFTSFSGVRCTHNCPALRYGVSRGITSSVLT